MGRVAVDSPAGRGAASVSTRERRRWSLRSRRRLPTSRRATGLAGCVIRPVPAPWNRLPACRGRGEPAALAQEGEDLLGRLLDRLLGGVDRDLGILRGLVRVADAGEVLDDSGLGLLVEALRVTVLEHV